MVKVDSLIYLESNRMTIRKEYQTCQVEIKQDRWVPDL